jgi:hypothetical protein
LKQDRIQPLAQERGTAPQSLLLTGAVGIPGNGRLRHLQSTEKIKKISHPKASSPANTFAWCSYSLDGTIRIPLRSSKTSTPTLGKKYENSPSN